MKKILIAIVALLFVSKISNAQTEKGTQNLGLNLGYGHLEVNNNTSNPTFIQSQKSTAFNIGPDYSFFVANNLDLGVSLSYNTSSQESENYSPYKQSGHGYSASIYMRKYFLYDGKIGIRTGGRLAYSHNNAKSTNSPPNNVYDYESKGNSYFASAGLELVAYPAKKLGIAASLASATYSHAKSDSGAQGTTEVNTFNLGFANNGLTMSVFYVLGKK